jgi:hypothetical protein
MVLPGLRHHTNFLRVIPLHDEYRWHLPFPLIALMYFSEIENPDRFFWKKTTMKQDGFTPEK